MPRRPARQPAAAGRARADRVPRFAPTPARHRRRRREAAARVRALRARADRRERAHDSPVDQPIAFTATGHAGALVRWGWDEPGQDITWWLGAQSTIAFAVASPCSAIRFSYVPYSPPGGETNHLTVVVNGARRPAVMTEQHTCRVDLHDNPLQPGEPALIEFLASRPRRPDIDGGDEKRPLGFGLFELELIGVSELHDFSRRPADSVHGHRTCRRAGPMGLGRAGSGHHLVARSAIHDRVRGRIAVLGDQVQLRAV